jgi:hypothetical protein
MSFDLTFEQKRGYLHAVVTGTNSVDAVMGYLAVIQRECVERRCFRVLIEERLAGPRLGALDVIRIAEEGSRNARNTMAAIAYVDVYADGPLMKLAEDVAVNRGVRVEVFRSVADAEAWLDADGRAGPLD